MNSDQRLDEKPKLRRRLPTHLPVGPFRAASCFRRLRLVKRSTAAPRPGSSGPSHRPPSPATDNMLRVTAAAGRSLGGYVASELARAHASPRGARGAPEHQPATDLERSWRLVGAASDQPPAGSFTGSGTGADPVDRCDWAPAGRCSVLGARYSVLGTRYSGQRAVLQNLL